MSTLCDGVGDMFEDTLRGDCCPPQATSARGSPSHISQVTTEAHSEWMQKCSFGCSYQTSRKIYFTLPVSKAEVHTKSTTTPSQEAARKMSAALTQISLPCGALAEGRYKWQAPQLSHLWQWALVGFGRGGTPSLSPGNQSNNCHVPCLEMK